MVKISIELDTWSFNKETIILSSTDFLKSAIRYIYKWLTTDGEALGYILGHIHFMLFILLILCVLISHTLYPNFWFQLLIFCIIFIIWLQHIFLKVCVSIVAEKELTNNKSPFHELLETMFGISTDDFINYFIVAETFSLGFLGLELIARISSNIFRVGL